MDENRRRVERIRLREPIEATIEEQSARIRQVGLLGCQIEHPEMLHPGSVARLAFSWGGEDVVMYSLVVFSELHEGLTKLRGVSVFQSGLEFREGVGTSGATLKKMIASFVARELEQQRINAQGKVAEWARTSPFFNYDPSDLTHEVEPDEHFVCCIRRDSGWARNYVTVPRQPENGFTISAMLGDEEIEMLCDAWDASDREGRRFIRMCAELAIARDDVFPPRRFV